MPYIYAADLWCDSCGEAIKADILSKASPAEMETPVWQDDSDVFPQYVGEDTGESDSPSHCGSGETCLECETLPSGRKIGALLSTSLTREGETYVKEKVREGGEVAEFWKSAFDWIDFPIPPCPDAFFDAYVECALWSSTDNADESGGSPLDDNYGPEDIAPECLKSMREDCDAFWNDNPECHDDASRAGHDFWLTRNGHGAGFWDGDWPDDAGKKLTDASHAYGSSDLYIGDDGKVYCS
jgi:hypothetical protein